MNMLFNEVYILRMGKLCNVLKLWNLRKFYILFKYIEVYECEVMGSSIKDWLDVLC